VLYGSMLTTSLVSALMGIFGRKAKFIVTPKASQRIDFWFALRFQWKELAFSTLLLIISLIFQRGVLPVILIVATGYASLGLLFLSNVRYSERETQKIDEQTEQISLEINELFAYNRKVERERTPQKRGKLVKEGKK
jgi:hypothetical protein